MIIQLDQFRKARDTHDVDTYELRRLFGNTVPKMSLREIAEEAKRSTSQRLPECFENFDARDFIVNAYALATQI